jgi:hypothetical protein
MSVQAVAFGLATLVDGVAVAQRNPTLVVPRVIPPLGLDGTVIDTHLGRGLQASVRLFALPNRDSIAFARADQNGRFSFLRLAAGRYLLDTRSIGFTARLDTVVLSTPPGLGVQLVMQESHYCLDGCPADSAVVAAALAQADGWVCDREPASIEASRSAWAGALATDDLRSIIGVSGDSARIATELRLVTDDEDCRKIARQLREPIALAFTVFHLGAYWLINQPAFWSATVFDSKLESVIAFNGMFWAGPPKRVRRTRD